jgi:hypothetical protein
LPRRTVPPRSGGYLLERARTPQIVA